MQNFSADVQAELNALGSSSSEFCKEWTTKWKPIASTLQPFLPGPAGTIFGFLIQIADSYCKTS
jgi:hypothetical protein